MILTPTHIKYYKNENDHKDAPILEKGAILLSDIKSIKIIARNVETKELYRMTKPGIAISVNRWTKCTYEQEAREFIFAFDTENDMNSWKDAIEFVHQKSLFESFVTDIDPRTVNWGSSAYNKGGKNQSNGNLMINVEESSPNSPLNSN